MNCQSCGMPMEKPEDHGGGDVNNPFCKYCTDPQGNLLPRDQVRAKMIQFFIQKQSKTQEEAEKATDQLMGAMPAWKGEGVAVPIEPQPESSVVVPEPTVSEPAEGAAVPGVTPEPSESTAEPTTEEPTETPTKPIQSDEETPAE